MLPAHDEARASVRLTVGVVALINLLYFGIEAGVAVTIQSVSLIADSVDFLEDAAVNLLVLVAIGWVAARRRLVGIGLAGLILIPGLAAFWMAGEKLLSGAPVVPGPWPLTITALGALCVNSIAALLLAGVRHHGGSLSRAAFLSARNDVFANVAIIGAGVATAALMSHWPDVVVGVAIAVVNISAAHEVYEAALGESDDDAGRGDAEG